MRVCSRCDVGRTTCYNYYMESERITKQKLTKEGYVIREVLHLTNRQLEALEREEQQLRQRLEELQRQADIKHQLEH